MGGEAFFAYLVLFLFLSGILGDGFKAVGLAAGHGGPVALHTGHGGVPSRSLGAVPGPHRIHGVLT
jgi:hypothetical protein